MAKEEMADQSLNENAPAAKNGRKSIIMVGILVGAMLIEGVVVAIVVKSFTPPAAAEASVSGLDPQGGQKAPEDVEIEVVKFRAQNEKSQRQQVYEFDVFAVVQDTESTAFTDMVTKKKATIQDRFTRIIRAADPERFAEPDLAGLRKQFQNELSQLAGKDDMVKEVLIPSLVAYGE